MKKYIYGFLMAMADSVPGVSGGSIAYILGFYEEFINSLNNIVSKDQNKRKQALSFLVHLGIGWIIGMIISILVLSSFFQSKIYHISSLFLGFIFASIIMMVKDFKIKNLNIKRIIIFILGLILVVSLSLFKFSGINSMSDLSIANGLYVFIVGMLAISAMVLPGISGSTILLIFGIYVPIIYGLKSLMKLDLSVFPMLFIFGLGVICGILLSIKIIKKAYEKHQISFEYFILGMLSGSLYAIVQGPLTLQKPMPSLDLSTFNLIFFIIGIMIVAALTLLTSFTDD